MKPTIEQIAEIIYATMPLSRRDVIIECSEKINALYENSKPEESEIYEQADFYAMLVCSIDTTFEDGFYTGVKWALNRDKK